jgi:hypothetical protein
MERNSQTKRGWRLGLENIHSFGKTLAINSMWRVIKGDDLWHQVIWKKKYVDTPFEEWIRLLAKPISSVLQQNLAPI